MASHKGHFRIKSTYTLQSLPGFEWNQIFALAEDIMKGTAKL